MKPERTPDPDPRFRVPISDAQRALLNELSYAVDNRIPEGWGFVLLLTMPAADADSHTDVMYTGNLQREDAIKVMSAFVQHEGR